MSDSDEAIDYPIRTRFRSRPFVNPQPVHEGRYSDNNAYAVAIDCEMVEDDKGKDMLARVSVVDQDLNTLYNKFVKPTAPIKDYRTQFSGVRPTDLTNAENFYNAQAAVSSFLAGALLVGHQVDHDLEVLKLDHPKERIRDTSAFGKFVRENRNRTPALRHLARRYLSETIQSGEHDSVQDAKTAMKLYLRYMN